MYQSMPFGQSSSVFKADAKNSDPFPPAYYENKKRAGELIAKMTNMKPLHKKP